MPKEKKESGSSEKTPLELRKEKSETLTKGFPVIGMRKVKVADLTAADDVPEYAFILAIGFDEYCRTEQDIREVMSERDVTGTIFPMRAMNGVTRTHVQKAVFQ